MTSNLTYTPLDLDSELIAKSEPAQTDENHAEKFRKWIEFESLEIIKAKLAQSDIPEDRIQALAQRVLDVIHPGMSMEELFEKAITLNEGYPEYDQLVVKLMKEYEMKYQQKAVTTVQQMIRQGNYDAAQDVVKKILEFKLSI